MVHRTSVDTRIGNTGTWDRSGYRNTEGTLAHRTSVDTGVKMEHRYRGREWIQG